MEHMDIQRPLTAASPQSGEHFEFHESFRGPHKRFRFTWTLSPGKPGPGEHIHPEESHACRVVSGEVAVWMDGVRRDFRAGDAYTIAPGVAHRFKNFGPAPVVVECVNDGPTFEDFAVPIAVFGQRTGGKITFKMGAQILVQIVATDPNIPVGSTVWLARILRVFAWTFVKLGMRPLPPVIGWEVAA